VAQLASSRKAQVAALAAIDRVWKVHRRLFELVRAADSAASGRRNAVGESNLFAFLAFLMGRGDELGALAARFAREVESAASTARAGLHGLGALHAAVRSNESFPGESAGRAAWNAMSELARDIRRTIGEARTRERTQRRSARNARSIEVRRQRGRDYYARLRERGASAEAGGNDYIIARAVNRRERTAERRAVRQTAPVLDVAKLLRRRFSAFEVGALEDVAAQLRWERERVVAAESSPPRSATRPGSSSKPNGARSRATEVLQKALEIERFDITSIRDLARRVGCNEKTLRDLPKWKDYAFLRRASLAVQSESDAERVLDQVTPAGPRRTDRAQGP
jgi:hypothetical protein